jgi:hypothetical protein
MAENIEAALLLIHHLTVQLLVMEWLLMVQAIVNLTEFLAKVEWMEDFNQTLLLEHKVKILDYHQQ